MSKKFLKFKIILSAGLLFCMSGLAYGAELKIAYINLQQVIKESAAGKKMSDLGNQMIQKKRSEISNIENEINKMFNEYKEKEMVLSPDAKKEIKDKIEQKMIDKERFEKDSFREVRKFEKKVIAEIMGEVNKIIKQLGKDEGYTLILDSTGGEKDDKELPTSSILYATPELNITHKVIAIYDKQYAMKKK